MSRWIEATDPLGGTERLEYRFSVDEAAVPAKDPTNKVPAGFSYNQYLNLRNSFYWDKRAWAQYPGDYTKARLTHWLWSSTLTIAPVPASTKEPLEGRVWHEHEGGSMPGGISPIGRPARIGRVLEDGTSQVTRYEYNSKGHVTRVTDPRGRATVYEYAADDVDLEHVRQVVGPTTTELLATITYRPTDPPRSPGTLTDAAGQTTTMTYDARGRVLTTVTPPRNGPGGTPLSLAERTTTYAYFGDSASSGPGRPQTITGPSTSSGSPVTAFTYDGYGRVRTTTEPDGYALTFDYDVLDRPTRTTFPDGTTTQTRYNRLDAEGSKDRLSRWTTTFHDALGRMIAQRDPAGRMTRLEWCTCGSLDKLVDANGHATTWERDVQGRVLREIRPDNAAWQYAYDVSGRLLTRTDPKGQVTTYTYFSDDRLKGMAYTNASVATATVSFTYDPTYDRVATMVDGTGTTTYGYHAIPATPALGAGQLASVSGPFSSSTVSYTYDELRRVATHGLSGAVSTWKYDALGRPASLTHPIGTFTYAYDGVTARPLTLTYPNSQSTAYAYLGHTGDHRLQEIKHLAPDGAVLSKFNYGYDAVGNITSWTQQVAPDPAKVYSFGYDRADQLTAATLRSTDATPVLLKRYGYAYDPAGNRTAEQIDNAVTGASYNARNELLSRQTGGAMFFRGTLNEPGTVTVNGQPATVTAAPGNAFEAQVTLPAGTSTATIVATDASNNQRTSTYQVSTTGSTATYTHDANGNLTSDGVKTYEWDAENRLARVHGSLRGQRLDGHRALRLRRAGPARAQGRERDNA